MSDKIWLSSPHMSGYEQEFVDKAFKSNWVAPLGPNVKGFETDLEKFLGKNSYVAALSSGTAAIHLALLLLDVKQGDEVLCQTKTFVASVNPVIYVGASPILIDSEKQTWNMSAEMLENAIIDRINLGKKPKAVIAINIYGMPYNVKEIHNVANKYDVAIIEDSAEALGSKYNDEYCGTFGDVSILSFNGNKIITTSGGGALISRDIKMKEKAIFLATQAKDEGIDYNHSQVGYNYRMSNISAGIGRGQMKVLNDRIMTRRKNHAYYYENLNMITKLEFLMEPNGYFSNRWLTCVLTDSEKTKMNLLFHLNKKNIDARPSWKPMHRQSLYKHFPKYLNGVSDDLYERGICLPSGSNLTKNELDKVIDVIKNYFTNE